MDSSMLIELMGYVSSILVVVSMLMPSIVKLRVFNSIGAGVSLAYALIIQSYPIALMNACLVGINIYNLVKLSKTEHHFDLINGKNDDTFLKFIVDYYNDDIKKYFPDFKLDPTRHDNIYIVFCDSIPAGFLLGRRNGTVLEVVLDYSTPAYRDCSVGSYLYKKLVETGIHEFRFIGGTPDKVYIEKMGFVNENGQYVKRS
ncbi:MAG: hypothetical protein U0L05_03005 [Schaedlerella sp.]|nr:hypothetical protein [Schaedlerella sp.]